MGADQVDKADPGQLLDLVFALHQLHQLQDLPAPVAHEHDQKTGIGWFSAAAVALGLSFLVAQWLTRPVARLTRYAEEVRAGGRAVLPSLGGTELCDMGLVLESMREALEGKKLLVDGIHRLQG